MSTVLMTVGAALLALWGIAHLLPTRGVADGFGEITVDNRRILVMEWMIEGFALIFIGALIIMAACVWGPANPHSAHLVYACAAMLVALAVLSVFTGFRVNFLPFRLCPFIFTTSAVLIVAGVHLA
jgi:hypothetical protein